MNNNAAHIVVKRLLKEEPSGTMQIIYVVLYFALFIGLLLVCLKCFSMSPCYKCIKKSEQQQDLNNMEYWVRVRDEAERRVANQA